MCSQGTAAVGRTVPAAARLRTGLQKALQNDVFGLPVGATDLAGGRV
jgi:hypothetical protein